MVSHGESRWDLVYLMRVWDTMKYGEIWWHFAGFDEILWDSMRFGEIQWDMVRFGSKYGCQSAILDNIQISNSPD